MNDNQSEPDTLLVAVSNLPQEIKPSRDLWPGIAGQLSLDNKSSGINSRFHEIFDWFNWRVAASLTGATLGVLFAVLLVNNHESREDASNNVVLRAANYLPVTLNADYRAARDPLIKTFEESLGALSPTERTKVERGLTDIQSALRVLNEAAQQHPENMTLQHLVLSTYQRELEYMQSIVTLTKHLPEDITL